MLSTLFYKTLSFHFSLQQFEKNRFYKLTTEIELVHLYKQHLQNQLTFNDANSYHLIKIADTSNSSQLIYDNMNQKNTSTFQTFNELILKLDCIVIIQRDNRILFYSKDPLIQTEIIKSQQITNNQQQTQSYTVYMYPSSQKLINKKDDYLKICQILNAVYLNNSLSFKYLNYNNIRFLESYSYKALQYGLIYEKITSIKDLIRWENIEELEILFQILSEDEHYNSQEQEYKSQFEFFDGPKDNLEKGEVMSNILNTFFYHYTRTFANPMVNVWGAFPSSLKEVMLIIKINDLIILDQNDEIFLMLQKLFPKHMKKNQILVLESKTQNIRGFFSEQLDLFNQEIINVNFDNPSYLVNQSTELFFRIQSKLNPQSVEEENIQELKREFKKILIKEFIINNL